MKREEFEPLFSYLRGKKILLLGMGREGKSSLAFLLRHQEEIQWAKLALADRVALDETFGLETHTGEDYLDCLGDFDLVLKAPGISLKSFERLPGHRQGLVHYPDTEITGQIDLTLRFLPFHRILAVSGTKGKSTTSTLLSLFLRECSRPVYFRGNIGIPVWDELEGLDSEANLCLELSSHQLEFCRQPPSASALTNFYPEHLDHYSSYEAYLEAKIGVMEAQGREDVFVLNSLEAELMERVLPKLKSKVILIRAATDVEVAQRVQAQSEILAEVILGDGSFELVKNGKKIFQLKPASLNPLLKGEHLLIDVAIASSLAYLEGLTQEGLERVCREFQGLPHRCERVAEVDGVTYVNDSISTIPRTCSLALETLGTVSVLYIGGMDRGVDCEELALELLEREGLHLFCLPDTGAYFYQYFHRFGQGNRVRQVADFASSIEAAQRVAQEALKLGMERSYVLLSPAASSYHRYKNFEERGDEFKQAVAQLQQKKSD